MPSRRINPCGRRGHSLTSQWPQQIPGRSANVSPLSSARCSQLARGVSACLVKWVVVPVVAPSWARGPSWPVVARVVHAVVTRRDAVVRDSRRDDVTRRDPS